MVAGIIAITLALTNAPTIAENAPVETSISVEIESNYTDIAEDIGRMYDINPNLILAIIEVESGGNPNAIAKSGSGAAGLMQIVPQYQHERCERLGVKSLYNPYNNILVGTDYLHELFEEYEDLNLVLTAYRYGVNSYQFENAKHGYIYQYSDKVVGIMEGR